MTVNLEKKEIGLQRVAGSGAGETVCSTSAMLQGGDRNVTVLSCRAIVTEKRKEVGNGVTLYGSVSFAVAYENGEGELRERRTQSDFELEIPVENAENGYAQVLCTVKGTEAKEKDGRLDVSALIEAQGVVLENVPTSLVTYVDAGETLACKTVDISYLSAPVTGENRALLNEEMALPAGQYRIAAMYVTDKIYKAFFLDGFVRVMGTVSVTALLAKEDNGLVPFSVTLPLDENVENSGFASGMTGEVNVQVSSLKGDILYGEEDSATLSVEAVTEVSVVAEKQLQSRGLQDCYPLSALPLSSVQENVTYITEKTTRSTTQNLTGSLNTSETIFAFVQIVALELPKEGGTVEGLLNLTEVAQNGEYSTQELPFSLDFGERSGEICGVTVGNAVFSGGGFSVPVTLQELGFAETSTAILTGTKEEPAPNLRPGVTICFTAPGESKWDVAKRCRVRENVLMDGKDGRSYMVYRRLTEA